MHPSSRNACALLAAIVAVAALALSQRAHAAGTIAGQEIDPMLKARMIKEKAKQNSRGASAAKLNFGVAAGAQCGGQPIGNVDPGGLVGQAPRESFVWMPDPINMIPAMDCK